MTAHNFIDEVGKTYGRLTVVERVEAPGQQRWRCFCSCGRSVITTGQSLRGGRTKSCGCLRAEATGNARRRHGKSGSRAHNSWCSMKGRCLNPNDARFGHYGGRGIGVCLEWATSFEAFLEDMGDPPPGHSLERIDVNGPYSSANCRWATQSDQLRNTRRNVWVSHPGGRAVLRDYVRISGIPLGTLKDRISRRGLSGRKEIAAEEIA